MDEPIDRRLSSALSSALAGMQLFAESRESNDQNENSCGYTTTIWIRKNKKNYLSAGARNSIIGIYPIVPFNSKI